MSKIVTFGVGLDPGDLVKGAKKGEKAFDDLHKKSKRINKG